MISHCLFLHLYVCVMCTCTYLFVFNIDALYLPMFVTFLMKAGVNLQLSCIINLSYYISFLYDITRYDYFEV